MIETPSRPGALYTVAETCRILQPRVTSRRVHYWLHSGLLGDPVRPEVRGTPTLLTFDQLVRVQVLQRLRDDLSFSLRKVREALGWVLEALGEAEWGRLEFVRTGAGHVGVRDLSGHVVAVGGQGAMPELLPELTAFLALARQELETGVIEVEGFPGIVSSARVMGGSPVLRGTRIETAFVANLAKELDIQELADSFDHVGAAALERALEFEGVRLAA